MNLYKSIKESALNTKYYVASYPESNGYSETYKNFTKYREAYNYLLSHVDAETIFECFNKSGGAFVEKLSKARDLENIGKLPRSRKRIEYLKKRSIAYGEDIDDDEFEDE